MPLPLFILGGLALLSGGAAVAKGAKAISDSSKANDVNSEARVVFESASKKLKNQKVKTTRSLETLGTIKLEAWNKNIGRFVKVFGQIKNVKLSGSMQLDNKVGLAKEELAQMEKVSLHAAEIVGGGIASLGAGALAGFGAYGGATMLATASTGTAISSLSGVAATNATLAWFGGGALSAGGLGMAGGTVVLGGIVAGPALLVGALVLSAKARAKLASAHCNFAKASEVAEQMKNATAALKGVQNIAVSFIEIIEELSPRIQRQITSMARIVRESGCDYSSYSKRQRETIHLTIEYISLYKHVLETPLLTKQGALKKGLLGVLENIQATKNSLENK